ncbi:hypothetical protein GTW71_37820, partial [Streptomyces sp. SID6041]|nr:hypothetical protein [Streptomyces sp. SID6041]
AGGEPALRALRVAAVALQAVGRGDSAEGRKLVGVARQIVQRKIGQRITEATSKPFADADHLLLTGDLAGAVGKLTEAYRAAG